MRIRALRPATPGQFRASDFAGMGQGRHHLKTEHLPALLQSHPEL
jgi:hypothetical protein